MAVISAYTEEFVPQRRAASVQILIKECVNPASFSVGDRFEKGSRIPQSCERIETAFQKILQGIEPGGSSGVAHQAQPDAQAFHSGEALQFHAHVLNHRQLPHARDASTCEAPTQDVALFWWQSAVKFKPMFC